ncbi:MAG: D-alanyl-D-alanine carboxypeptidase [Microbacteriaceae bacterium]|nr:MAG: D-alanyl-D-alanine carboxypeptidase [Microbacteriaceae bacterium]
MTPTSPQRTEYHGQVQTPPDRRSVYRRRRIVVFGALGALLISFAYSLGVLLAPLPASAATLRPTHTITSPAVKPAWPTVGSAAIGAVGYDGLLAQNGSTASVPIASMTKTITALVVLDAKPIRKGSDGPIITFTDADVQIFHRVIAEGGSWAPVVAGEQLTEKQALEAMLLPSANNYAISLAIWSHGSVSAFLAAANTWLKGHDLSGTHLTDPSGLDPGTVSTASDLVGIGKLVLTNPVLSSIVKTRTVTLPGAGTQDNGNALLGKDGIDGIKTGFTDEAGHCLMFSAQAQIGGHTVTLVGVVLNERSYDQLWNTVPPLLASAKSGFHSVPLTGAGKTFGTYTTPWGAKATLVSTTPSSTLVWSDTPITVSTAARPVTIAAAGDTIGTVTFTVGKTTVTKPLTLKHAVPAPGFWWRLTHPFVLLG